VKKKGDKNRFFDHREEGRGLKKKGMEKASSFYFHTGGTSTYLIGEEEK